MKGMRAQGRPACSNGPARSAGRPFGPEQDHDKKDWMNLDEVAHLAEVGGFEFDVTGRTLRVSESLGRMLQSPVQLPWTTVMTCLDDSSRKGLRAGWRKARRGAPARIRVLATVCSGQFWFQVDIAPVTTTDRGDITLKGCIADITGYVACEQQLIATATEARQHAVASGSQLSALSHEIRTPLGSILGLSRIGDAGKYRPEHSGALPAHRKGQGSTCSRLSTRSSTTRHSKPTG